MSCAERCFKVKTPVGVLRVYAKHDEDAHEDFPGIYVDLVCEGADVPLACVEFDSCDANLQTVVYGDGANDSPTDITIHRNLNL